MTSFKIIPYISREANDWPYQPLARLVGRSDEVRSTYSPRTAGATSYPMASRPGPQGAPATEDRKRRGNMNDGENGHALLIVVLS